MELLDALINVQLQDLQTTQLGIVSSNVRTEHMLIHLERIEPAWDFVQKDFMQTIAQNIADRRVMLESPFFLTIQHGDVWKHVQLSRTCTQILTLITANLIVQVDFLLISWNDHA